MKIKLTTKVVLQYIPIIIGALLISNIISGIAIRLYLEKEVFEDLKNEVAIMRNMITTELTDSKNIDKDTFKDLLLRSYKLDRVGLESQLEVIVKLPNNTIRTLSQKSQFDKTILNQIANKLQRGKDKFIIRSSKGNFKYYIATLPINKLINNNRKEKYWIILYTTTQEVATFTKNIFRINILIMLIVGIISIIIAILFARSITKPIIKLKNRAYRISKRDFNSSEKVDTGDEIEELSRSIEDMAMELKNYDLSQKRFLQNASHELKTPLTSIGGYAEGLKDGVFENTEEALDIIIDESLRLKKLVEQIIFLSKVETIEEFFKLEQLDLQYLLEQAVKKVKGLALKKSITIELQMKQALYIKADEEKLIQAFINILSNCIRHAKSNITITFTEQHSMCNIIICDDGEGFSNDDLIHLFDRFYKGNNGSTGLGMTITKSIIKKHNGDITVSNNKNGGARFIIKLVLS